jgi:hypothetical protein
LSARDVEQSKVYSRGFTPTAVALRDSGLTPLVVIVYLSLHPVC